MSKSARTMRFLMSSWRPFGLALAFVACTGRPARTLPDAGGAAAGGAEKQALAKHDQLPRMDWNRVATELALPIYWTEDANQDGDLQPNELASLWGVPRFTTAEWRSAVFVENGMFTATFEKAHARVLEAAKASESDPRRAAVKKELAQGRPSLVLTRFADAPEEDKAIVKHVLAAAEIIEKIYAKQSGVDGMEKDLPEDDPASRMVFYRNQGPWCEAPATETDPECNALASKPQKTTGLYPAEIQKDPKWCDALAARKDAERLLSPFTAVRKGASGDLEPVPYNEVYKEEMEQISRELSAAAAAISSPEETAFKAYLEAAAKSFLDNDWLPADEAWSKMSVRNSKWYLRIGPDETYHEPCARKAGFHVSFAKINKGSLEWQDKLDPVKEEMERALAALAGPPYAARKVSFHLPDFIDIIVNAGDSRSASGATIGQSLPNWGPVANQGRGRTVAMTNFYEDADSKKAAEEQAASLFCKDTMATFTVDSAPGLMGTVLHEAAHNLGPSHEYRARGKTDDQAFGGPLAATLEELKAQTSSLFFTDWLGEKKLISPDMVAKGHTRNLFWAFGHISRGMYDSEGKPKPYSQLAAIQVGYLLKEGALEWRADEAAANGKDRGCFEIHLDRFPAAVRKMTTAVAGIKARGDKPLADSLRTEHVDKDGPWKSIRATISERVLRSPKASFVYSIDI